MTPECREGQHHACRGDIWAATPDNPNGCDCTCHKEKDTDEHHD